MNEEEWQKLHEGFETATLLDAVGYVDELRGYLGDADFNRPPEIRDNLLKLHGLTMDVVNNGWDTDLPEMTEMVMDMQSDAAEILHQARKLYNVLTKLMQLLPDSAFEMDAFDYDEEE